MSFFKRRKLTDYELEERDEKRERFFPDIVAFAIAGAFIGSERHWNEGLSFEILDVLYHMFSCAFVAVLLGLAAKYIYIWYLNEVSTFDHVNIFTFSVALLLAFLLPLIASTMINGQDSQYRCIECEKRVGEENDIKINDNDDICADCLTNGLQAGEYGFCESCKTIYRSYNMLDGLCENCFEYYIEKEN